MRIAVVPGCVVEITALPMKLRSTLPITTPLADGMASRLSIFSCMDHSRLIAIEPGKRGGRPCIRGMRITVRDVLKSLAGGMTVPDGLLSRSLEPARSLDGAIRARQNDRGRSGPDAARRGSHTSHGVR